MHELHRVQGGKGYDLLSLYAWHTFVQGELTSLANVCLDAPAIQVTVTTSYDKMCCCPAGFKVQTKTWHSPVLTPVLMAANGKQIAHIASRESEAAHCPEVL